MGSSDKAFKSSVRPLAVMFILIAIMMLLVFTSWPSEDLSKFIPLPFVPDSMNFPFLVALAILNLIIGVGLFLRSRIAWIIMITYSVVGPLWIILGIAFDAIPKEIGPKLVIIPLTALFAIVTAVGMFFITKPAFTKAS